MITLNQRFIAKELWNLLKSPEGRLGFRAGGLIMQHTRMPIRQGAASSILVVDDHPLYSDALETALEVMFSDVTIRKARSLGQALGAIDDGFEPDLVMFDLKLPDVTGISGFQSLRARLPDTQILVISSLASFELVQSLIQEGAAGFLPKDAPVEELHTALTALTSGCSYLPKVYRKATHCEMTAMDAEFDHPKLPELTPQQKRIMRLICKGKPNKQIAYELGLAEATVKAHITALMRRLDVRNRTQAVVLVEELMAEMRGDEPEARAFLRH